MRVDEADLRTTAALYKDFANRLRRTPARTEVARKRLRMIAAEFDAVAEEIDLRERTQRLFFFCSDAPGS